jgi:hypothetical protein
LGRPYEFIASGQGLKGEGAMFKYVLYISRQGDNMWQSLDAFTKAVFILRQDDKLMIYFSAMDEWHVSSFLVKSGS